MNLSLLLIFKYLFNISILKILKLSLISLILSLYDVNIVNCDIYSSGGSTILSLDASSNEIIGLYKKERPIFVTNLTSIIGKQVNLNCSLNSDNYENGRNKQQLKYSQLRQSPLQSAIDTSTTLTYNNPFRLNPTWLKADVYYDQYGNLNSYKTENIIVTRKGIIPDIYRDKMKLITVNEKLQILRLNEVDIKDEGKYICREFNSQHDKLFYLNVYSPIKELNIKFTSNSKYFRELYTPSSASFLNPDIDQNENNEENLRDKNGINYDTTTVSIKENDELMINCVVNSSKPAANITIWITNRQNRRSMKTVGFDNEAKMLNIIDSHTYKNKDLTLKSVSVAKYIVSRNDNHKLIACMAENTILNEKWETKRILNVLYGPKCSKNQRLVYNTGINQSVELECHMTEANPPYLDFTWNFANQFNSNNKDRIRQNGFSSRINYTPKNENDFGEISCIGSNGLDPVQCKMMLQLGGPPNPPYDCYHKENNKTIIIECKPGFDQGDPEVYFFLLKKKTNGALVEYARKRDSCSFLISSLILEEHLNDFYIYSSNKYGNNQKQATKITIENKDFLFRNTNKLQDLSIDSNKRITIIGGAICLIVLFMFFLCCIAAKCKSVSEKPMLNGNMINHKDKNLLYNNNNNSFKYQQSNKRTSSYPSLNGKLGPNRYTNSNSTQFLNYQEPFKYLTSGPITGSSHYNSKSSLNMEPNGVVLNNNNNNNKKNSSNLKLSQSNQKINYDDKNNTDSSSSTDLDIIDTTNIILNKNNFDNSSFKKSSLNKLNQANSKPQIRSPSLINNIQDLDMSPRSKRKSIEKLKEAKDQYACSKSLIDESTETESENYLEFHRTKIKADFFENYNSLSEDQSQDNLKHEYYLTSTTGKYTNISRVLNNSSRNGTMKLNRNNNTNENLYTMASKTNKPPPLPLSKPTLWFTDSMNTTTNDSYDEYTGIANDLPTSKSINRFNALVNKPSSMKKTSITTSNINNLANNNNIKIMNRSNNSVTNSPMTDLYDNSNLSSSNGSKEDTSLLNWSKNTMPSLFNNLNSNINNNSTKNHDTISLDVDDEKIVGILV